MAQIGDILRGTFVGTYLNQQIVNVFFWEIDSQSTGNLVLGDFATEIVTRFDNDVVSVLNVGLVYDTFTLENLTNQIGLADLGINLVGGNTGQNMPSSVALGVRLNRATKLTRNGAKRFAGLSEDKVNNNQLQLNSVERAQIEGFCGTDYFYLDYDGQGNDVGLDPVIVGRTKNASGVYELDLTRVNNVNSATLRNFVSTQNTRKP